MVIYNRNRNGQEILDLFNQDFCCKQIAARLKTTEPTVKSVLLKFGIDYMLEYSKKQQAKYEEAFRLYQEGKPFKKTCKNLGIGPNQFRPYVKERLGTFRTQKESLVLNMDRSEEATLKRSQFNKWYPLNETAFNDLSYEEVAYWIGFLYADGTIGRGEGKYQIVLGLKEKDYGHLIKYCQFFNTPQERIKYIESGKAYSVTLSSYSLWKRLRDLGFNNRKSWTAIPPIELKNNRHFWRGVLDGDGSIFLTHRLYQSRKSNLTHVHTKSSVDICGTSDTVEGFIAFISALTDYDFHEKRIGKIKETFHVFRIGARDDVNKVLDLLYKDATIYLERKHLKYLEFKTFYNAVT